MRRTGEHWKKGIRRRRRRKGSKNKLLKRWRMICSLWMRLFNFIPANVIFWNKDRWGQKWVWKEKLTSALLNEWLMMGHRQRNVRKNTLQRNHPDLLPALHDICSAGISIVIAVATCAKYIWQRTAWSAIIYIQCTIRSVYLANGTEPCSPRWQLHVEMPEAEVRS